MLLNYRRRPGSSSPSPPQPLHIAAAHQLSTATRHINTARRRGAATRRVLHRPARGEPTPLGALHYPLVIATSSIATTQGDPHTRIGPTPAPHYPARATNVKPSRAPRGAPVGAVRARAHAHVSWLPCRCGALPCAPCLALACCGSAQHTQPVTPFSSRTFKTCVHGTGANPRSELAPNTPLPAARTTGHDDHLVCCPVSGTSHTLANTAAVETASRRRQDPPPLACSTFEAARTPGTLPPPLGFPGTCRLYSGSRPAHRTPAFVCPDGTRACCAFGSRRSRRRHTHTLALANARAPPRASRPPLSLPSHLLLLLLHLSASLSLSLTRKSCV